MPEERRVVTILFADITGSTALGESSDPEDVRTLLGRYYAIAREVIAAHGGTLEKFIGDAVMAVFGIPQAHGDDAERALIAALALREAVALDPQTKTITLRMGVNTGEVVATREQSAGDFLVTGDAVNIAARLQQQAEPGAIVVGDRTRRAVSNFRFGETQRIEVKGKREPISGAALAERVIDQHAPRAPFLGRDHDLAQLDLVARRAFGERRPQLVTITAPAGTGKSRLVEEFALRLPRRDVTVATGQCLPYGGAVTFLPLQGLVRGLLHIPREAETLPALRQAFAGAGYAEKDAERLASLIAVTLGEAVESERVDRDEIFSAWRLLIEGLAAHGPLLVVFEDLHWASDTLLDLVENVTVSRTSAPLVMVALARPELLDRRPHWGGGRRNFTALSLEPLSSDEARQLVNVLTEGVPGAMTEHIVDRAGGNPFFVGELVRAFEERRRAGEDEDRIQLPDTVHATVLARIDSLPASERTVLELAAVAGRTARVAALKTLLPEITEDAAVTALDALCERELLVAQGAGTYMFRHIVIREVAYATLPRSQRVRAHLHLAEWLERDAPASRNELAELVAYHYRQAISLTPGGGLPEGLALDKVLRALETAATAAWNAGAFTEAAQQLREAIRLAPPEQHLRLFELLGDVMRFGDEAVNGYREAIERWRASAGADPQIGARLMVKRLGVYTRWSGSLSRPLPVGDFPHLIAEVEGLLRQRPDALIEARLSTIRAFRTIYTPGVHESEVRALLRGAEAARRLHALRGDAEAESEALDALGSLHHSIGEVERALEYAQDRIAMSDRLGILERADAWGVAAWDLTTLGRYEEAIGNCVDARRTLRPGEPAHMFSHAAAWAAFSAMLCGRWDEALELGDFLVVQREEVGVAVGRFTTPGWLGALRVAAARLDSARIARYRSAFTAVMDVKSLPEGEVTRLFVDGIIEGIPAAIHQLLRQPEGARDRRSEALMTLLFDLGERATEEELAVFAGQFAHDSPLVRLRIALAHALNDGPDAIRAAIIGLDAGNLVADAARAAALLALRTHDAADRADAERRLRAVGDRLFLQRLAEA